MSFSSPYWFKTNVSRPHGMGLHEAVASRGRPFARLTFPVVPIRQQNDTFFFLLNRLNKSSFLFHYSRHVPTPSFLHTAPNQWGEVMSWGYTATDTFALAVIPCWCGRVMYPPPPSSIPPNQWGEMISWRYTATDIFAFAVIPCWCGRVHEWRSTRNTLLQLISFAHSGAIFFVK